jgi:hypothetical protein
MRNIKLSRESLTVRFVNIATCRHWYSQLFEGSYMVRRNCATTDDRMPYCHCVLTCVGVGTSTVLISVSLDISVSNVVTLNAEL